MSKMSGQWLGCFLGLLVVSGCATHTSTNLTPRRLPREADNYYHFETSWRTNLRGVNSTNIQAFVMLDENLLPMKPVPFTTDRFEAYIQLPAGKTYIPYRFRFDYESPGLGVHRKNSDLSPSYRLIVPANPSEPITTTQPPVR